MYTWDAYIREIFNFLDDIEMLTGPAFKEMLRFKACDIWNRSEDMGTVDSGALYTVTVVYATVASFLINVKLCGK